MAKVQHPDHANLKAEMEDKIARQNYTPPTFDEFQAKLKQAEEKGYAEGLERGFGVGIFKVRAYLDDLAFGSTREVVDGELQVTIRPKAVKKVISKEYKHRVRYSESELKGPPDCSFVCSHLKPEVDETVDEDIAALLVYDPSAVGINYQVRYCQACCDRIKKLDAEPAK
jgi:hypothetical protein